MLVELCLLFIGAGLASIVSIVTIVGVNYLLDRKENDDA